MMYCTEVKCANLAPCKEHKRNAVGVRVKYHVASLDCEPIAWELHFDIRARGMDFMYTDYNPGAFTFQRWMDFADGKVDLRHYYNGTRYGLTHLGSGYINFETHTPGGPLMEVAAPLSVVAPELKEALIAARTAKCPFHEF